MAGIKETSEFLDGGAKIMNDVAEKKENDGAVSVIEELELSIEDAPEAVKAAMGAQNIWAEVMDADQAEKDVLLEKSLNFSKAGLRLFKAFSA